MSEFYTITAPVLLQQGGECRAAIAVGERYCRHNGKEEGYVFTATVCLRCQGMRYAAFNAFDWDEGPAFGELRDELKVEWDIADPEAWYDAILAEQSAQAELRQILADAATAYQTGACAP